MRWAGHVARMGKILLGRGFLRKLGDRDHKEDMGTNIMRIFKWTNSPQYRTSKLREGVEVQLYSSFNLDAGWWWVVNATPRSLYAQERDPLPVIQEAGWAPGPVWKCAENLSPNEIQFPDRPAHSECIFKWILQKCDGGILDWVYLARDGDKR